MLFNSMQFLIFMPIVVLLYYAMPRFVKMYWLLAASYFFYMCWNAKYALLLLFSTSVTYVCSLILERVKRSQVWKREKTRKRVMKLVLALSLIANLAVLFFFKYLNFACGVLSSAAELVHVELNLPAFDIVLPVGISFFTFQAMSYVLDVHRGREKLREKILSKTELVDREDV